MIYCKKIDVQYSDIEIEGDNYTILHEVSTILSAVHDAYLKNQPQYAPVFRRWIQDMAKEGSAIWRDDDKEEKYDLQ